VVAIAAPAVPGGGGRRGIDGAGASRAGVQLSLLAQGDGAVQSAELQSTRHGSLRRPHGAGAAGHTGGDRGRRSARRMRRDIIKPLGRRGDRISSRQISISLTAYFWDQYVCSSVSSGRYSLP